LLQANINAVKAASVQNDASQPIIRSRPPKSPRTSAARAPPAVGLHRSSLTPDEHVEISSYLQREPSSSTTTHRRRAASLPPPVSRPSVPRWFPSSSAYYGRRSYGAVPTGLPPSSARRQPSDAVVGVAHTSLYGDIVIGIPYKKRFMFNAQVPVSSVT